MTITFKPVGDAFYQEIARSHPSLLSGKVICGKCGRSRVVDPARCMQQGWPKCPCGGGTMGLAATEVTK